MTLFITTIIALIIIDFTLFGFLAYIFKMYPGYRHLLSDGVLIKDDTHNLDRSWQGDRYKSLILTNKHLIITNSFFTSVKNIDVNSIELCTVEKKRRNRFKITILVMDNNKKSKLSFISEMAEGWISSFHKIGVNVEGPLGV